MKIYWLNIDIVFTDPFFLEGENGSSEKRIDGALMEMGISCQSDQDAVEIVKNELLRDELFQKRNFKVQVDHLGEINPDDVQTEIHEDEDIKNLLLGDPFAPGLWYCSGRAFYFNED